MAISRQQKNEIVSDVSEKLKNAKGVVFAKFDGLKVGEIQELRSKCREENVFYGVIKKRLVKIAADEAGVEGFDPKAFDAGVATVISYDDEVAPARIVSTFAKDHELLSAVGGILENAFIDQEKVQELAKLPSKQELLAKAVGSMKAPVNNFVGVLAANLRNFVGVLSAIKDSKES